MSPEELEGVPAPVRKLMEMLQGISKDDFTINLGMLDEGEVKTWNLLDTLKAEAEDAAAKYESTRRLFWSQLEARLQKFGKRIRIDATTGMILMHKEDK